MSYVVCCNEYNELMTDCVDHRPVLSHRHFVEVHKRKGGFVKQRCNIVVQCIHIVSETNKFRNIENHQMALVSKCEPGLRTI